MTLFLFLLLHLLSLPLSFPLTHLLFLLPPLLHLLLFRLPLHPFGSLLPFFVLILPLPFYLFSFLLSLRLFCIPSSSRLSPPLIFLIRNPTPSLYASSLHLSLSPSLHLFLPPFSLFCPQRAFRIPEDINLIRESDTPLTSDRLEGTQQHTCTVLTCLYHNLVTILGIIL